MTQLPCTWVECPQRRTALTGTAEDGGTPQHLQVVQAMSPLKGACVCVCVCECGMGEWGGDITHSQAESLWTHTPYVTTDSGAPHNIHVCLRAHLGRCTCTCTSYADKTKAKIQVLHSILQKYWRSQPHSQLGSSQACAYVSAYQYIHIYMRNKVQRHLQYIVLVPEWGRHIGSWPVGAIVFWDQSLPQQEGSRTHGSSWEWKDGSTTWLVQHLNSVHQLSYMAIYAHIYTGSMVAYVVSIHAAGIVVRHFLLSVHVQYTAPLLH